ncbi:uncharacterized protein UV8b_05868 [Ustilaginoidea virens]|uniref:Uncharacterized protein n=1 Tax=Ustilaginoidea virens TaxID=1159556 RepID=A0A8E5HU07_USTVR|nr:uncharacterized protein UV8b_05868 [Ustilaginoidea virens]QUC21625.1 hypothetical protein UV8b_05868 [Ustilaginoidea virens]
MASWPACGKANPPLIRAYPAQTPHKACSSYPAGLSEGIAASTASRNVASPCLARLPELLHCRLPACLPACLPALPCVGESVRMTHTQ